MTTTSTRPETTEAAAKSVSPAAAITVLALTAVLGLAALLGPNLAASDLGMAMSMGMTHYMELLAANQPWNLLLFMGAPVVLAETLAITELVLLFQREAAPEWVRRTSRIAGLLAGPVMVAILLHLLLNAVVPLTMSGGWRGPADVIAVGFYLSGVIPLAGITLVELGVVALGRRQAMKWHAIWIAVFLVVAHVAMIFGMLDPGVLGYVMAHQH
ncbi:MAG TPA: permease [Propionicimonas sp.]|nr:permease [Propionicimonas sp.]HQA78358.1 permease [Propionicimonas sp.]HQD97555.1 permease [Propionicimonas sp.]